MKRRSSLSEDGARCLLSVWGTQLRRYHRNEIGVNFALAFKRTNYTLIPRYRPTKSLFAMVRVKYRYLVVNVLYPSPLATRETQLPDVVQIHSPTPDAFHSGVLVRLIRQEVEELYGDYGMGMISAGLKGIPFRPHKT